MWIFTSKDSAGGSSSTSIGTALGAVTGFGSSSDDPLSVYTLESNVSSTEELSAPYRLNWSLQSATHRKTGERVTVFTCRLPQPQNTAFALPALVQTHKRTKTLRHPNILTSVTGTEITKTSTSQFHIVTEHVVPLQQYLRSQAGLGGVNFNQLASWGIFQITRAIAFLNDDCQLSHNALSAASVFVNRSGEWKLGHLDFVSPLSEAAQHNHDDESRSAVYNAPAGQSVDSWGLACLIWEVFNPERLTDSSQLTAKANLDRLPKQLQREYRRLLSTRIPLTTASGSGPHRRPSHFSMFLKSGFFNNDYISTLLFLEEIQLKDKQEKAEFLIGLGERAAGMFPDDICRYKILPHLVNSLQFGSAGIEALVPVLELSHLLQASDFDSIVLPVLVRLFAAPDRATRVRLLDQLPRFVEKLPRGVVETQVFPPVAAGFSDANPLVRETTIRAMVHLAPTLTSKTLNDTLIRHLTNLQLKDDQGGIRANATICLAKLAPRMEPAVRRGPLLNAFLRATRDPFAPSRQAAVTGLAASQTYFSTQDLAGKVIPCLSFVAVDQEKEIRDSALKALRGIIERLELASEDPTKGEPDMVVVGGGGGSVSSVSAAKLTAAGVGLGNWALGALSSLSSRLIASSASAQAVQHSSKQQENPNFAQDVQIQPTKNKAPVIVGPSKATLSPGPSPTARKNEGSAWDDLDYLGKDVEDGHESTAGDNEDIGLVNRSLDMPTARPVQNATAMVTKIPNASDQPLVDWGADDEQRGLTSTATLGEEKVARVSGWTDSGWDDSPSSQRSFSKPPLTAPSVKKPTASGGGADWAISTGGGGGEDDFFVQAILPARQEAARGKPDAVVWPASKSGSRSPFASAKGKTQPKPRMSSATAAATPATVKITTKEKTANKNDDGWGDW